MLFRIAEENKQRAAHAFTVERIAHDYGYKKSAMLYPKNKCIMHYYEIDMLDADRIICTVRHKNTDCIVALVWLSEYSPESIEVDQAELYRNCSNYPYRREYNEKYLKKYDQIACIVHGAIAAGLLFDTAEAPTEEETSTAGQDTACTDTEPQRAAQSEGTTAGGETIAQEGNEPQNATETPRKTIQTGERLYSHPHRHMVTVEGLQGELVKVIYKGRLYLVCCNDLYTDESETTPAMLPPQAAESAEKTADDTTPTAGDTTPTEGTQEGTQTAGTSEGAETTTPPHTEPPRAAGSVSQSDRRTRPAAPQSHGTTKGIQRHHRPPKTAYRAIQRAGRNTGRSSQDRRKVTFSAWMYKTGSDPPKI